MGGQAVQAVEIDIFTVSGEGGLQVAGAQISIARADKLADVAYTV